MPRRSPSASTVPFGPWPSDAQRRVGDVAGRLGRWSYRFVRDIIDEWSKDRVGQLAAEIAFFALLVLSGVDRAGRRTGLG